MKKILSILFCLAIVISLTPVFSPHTAFALSQSPLARSTDLDLSGIPADKILIAGEQYTVIAKYFDPDGRTDLKYCWLAINTPYGRIILLWYQDTYYAPCVSEHSEFAELSGVDVETISEGYQGYRLKWRFRLKTRLPEFTSKMDFGVKAEDDSSNTSGNFSYNDTNASFRHSLPGSQTITVNSNVAARFVIVGADNYNGTTPWTTNTAPVGNYRIYWAMVNNYTPSSESKYLATNGCISFYAEYPASTQGPCIRTPVDSIDFRSVTGFGNIEKSIVIYNDGDEALQISNIVKTSGSPDFTYSGPSCPFAIYPNMSEEIKIRYTPSSTGYKEAVFTIQCNDSDHKVVYFGVSGTGTPAQANVPQIRWAGEKIVLELNKGTGFEGCAVNFSITRGPGIPINPQTTVDNTGIARSILTSDMQGKCVIKASIYRDDHSLMDENEFVVYFLEFEDISLGSLTGNRTGAGMWEPPNPWDSTSDVLSATLNPDNDSLLRARVKGWFMDGTSCSTRTQRIADFDGDGSVDTLLPAGRWVLPDDWSVLAGPLWQHNSPDWDLIDTPDDSIVGTSEPGPYINQDSSELIAGFPVIGPLSLLDDYSGNPVVAADATIPGQKRVTVVPDEILTWFDCPMPPAEISFQVEQGPGYFKETDKGSVYYLDSSRYSNPFYKVEIPAGPEIPSYVNGGGYFWDSWDQSSMAQGPYDFWTFFESDSGQTPSDTTHPTEAAVYSDNHGEAIVYMNGNWNTNLGSLSKIQAIADYPYVKMQRSIYSRDVGITWSSSTIDNIPPIVDNFSANKSVIVVGETIRFSYSVSDPGGSGLKQVELWEGTDTDGDGQPNWPTGNTEYVDIQTISGQSASGYFDYIPTFSGVHWYGIHVVDNASNLNDERNSNTGGSPGVFGPIFQNINTHIFHPKPDGYNFSNKGVMETTLSKDTRERIFNSAFDWTGVRPITREKYFDLWDNLWLIGNCYGMSLSSLMEYVFPIYDNFLENQSYHCIYDFSEPPTQESNDNKFWIACDPISPVLEHILRYQIMQRSQVQEMAVPDDPLKIAKKMSEKFDSQKYVLCLINNKKQGHAVIPYKIKQVDSGYEIFIYNPNHPDYDDELPNKCWLEVKQGECSLWQQILPPFFKPKLEMIVDQLILTNIHELFNNGNALKPNIPVPGDTFSQYYLYSTTSSLFLKDRADQISGYKNGKYYNEIPGVKWIYNFGGQNISEVIPEFQQYVATNETDTLICVEGFQNGIYSLTKMGPGYFADITNVNTFEGAIDIYTISENTVILSFSEAQESKTYNLLLYNDSYPHETFKATNIPAFPGGKYSYNVDWEALSQGQRGVMVQIDRNGDGKFERVLYSDGELTGDDFAEKVPSVNGWGIAAFIIFITGGLAWLMRRKKSPKWYST
ncbi:MAG: choice-of-anchor D domain-containing protein [Dehalococcoidales bacterium]|nr:choice-of-anchor D domain-containing protein [Dehalococcoidales bacterium]